MTYTQFLTYAASTGVNAIVGIILAFVLEYSARYAAMTAKNKRLVFFGVCLVVPLLATGAGVLTDEWTNLLDPTWYNALVAAVLAAGAGTFAHTRKLSKL